MVVGSVNVDLVASVEHHPSPGETVLARRLDRYAGGKGANQAVAAAAAGAEAAMVGAVGDDDAGRAYRDRLGARGVDTANLRMLAGVPTGHALIVVDDAGENTIVVVPGANSHLGEQVVRGLGVAPGDVVLTQLEVPTAVVAAAARTAAAGGARLVLNAAPYTRLPAGVIELADPVVVNEPEAAALERDGATPGSLLVTRGAAGARWDGLEAPAVDVPDAEVVDTTGAGDAFCGALAAVLASGADHSNALTAALRAGADAVRRTGAQPEPRLEP